MAGDSRCLVSVDGTDFRICEQYPFNSQWWSYKHNGPGVWYEIGISIKGGDIVWVSSPYPCGEWPDLRIARDALIYMIEDWEILLGDSGYQDGNQYFLTPNGLNDNDQRMQAVVRARHEHFNRWFKEL